MNSAIPGIIKEWDGKKATIRPLIKIQYLDGSSLPAPEILDVPVITPATAYAGIKVPITVGDKVMLHICDRDIQDLLFNKETSGLEDRGDSSPPTKRTNNITDAVAYAGFQSLDDMIPSDEDLWIFNNRNKPNYSCIKIKSDGSIELVTNSSSIIQKADGEIDIQASQINITGDVIVDGDVTANGVSLTNHTHGGVRSGSSNTSPPNPS